MVVKSIYLYVVEYNCSIGLTNIAKMGLESKQLYTTSLTVSFEITYHKITIFKKFGGQIPKFARANFGNWPPIFFKDLNQKSAPHNKGFFYSKAILKVS